jgi:hypothetical protein
VGGEKLVQGRREIRWKPMTNEERIAKCIGYCRFLEVHGATWLSEDGIQTVGMISSVWIRNCLDGGFDNLPDTPYLIEGCECKACALELLRVAGTNTTH